MTNAFTEQKQERIRRLTPKPCCAADLSSAYVKGRQTCATLMPHARYDILDQSKSHTRTGHVQGTRRDVVSHCYSYRYRYRTVIPTHPRSIGACRQSQHRLVVCGAGFDISTGSLLLQLSATAKATTETLDVPDEDHRAKWHQSMVYECSKD
jgi:hypothetical protein